MKWHFNHFGAKLAQMTETGLFDPVPFAVFLSPIQCNHVGIPFLKRNPDIVQSMLKGPVNKYVMSACARGNYPPVQDSTYKPGRQMQKHLDHDSCYLGGWLLLTFNVKWRWGLWYFLWWWSPSTMWAVLSAHSLDLRLASCRRNLISSCSTERLKRHQRLHNNVIKWTHFARYWPFGRGIHRWPMKFPSQMPVTRSFDVFFGLCLNKLLSKQSWGWWFETPSRSLWRQYNVGAEG